MKIEFVEKNYDIGNKLKDLITRKISKLDRYFEDDSKARVVCSLQNKTFKIQYTEIEKPSDIDAFFLFQFNGQLFYIRKSDLKENSILFGLFNQTTKNQYTDQKTDKLRIISRLLVVGSVFSLFFAAQSMMALSEMNGKSVENSWLFFLFLPVTIASVIFGCKTKNQNIKTGKNIAVGIIFSVILCIYGSFCFIFSDTYNYDPVVVETVENYAEIEIPEPSRVQTQDYIQSTGGVTLGGM